MNWLAICNYIVLKTNVKPIKDYTYLWIKYFTYCYLRVEKRNWSLLLKRPTPLHLPFSELLYYVKLMWLFHFIWNVIVLSDQNHELTLEPKQRYWNKDSSIALFICSFVILKSSLDPTFSLGHFDITVASYAYIPHSWQWWSHQFTRICLALSSFTSKEHSFTSSR